MKLIRKALKRVLETAKSIVFERGHLIYWLNIPSFRKSAERVAARPLHRPIRIGFLLQVPNNWAVIQSVYEAALRDPETEPVVLLMPELEFSFYIKLKNVFWEKTYAFGEKNFGDKAIRTYDPENGTWLSPAELELDYVFIPRPYETYLPEPWRASSLRKITRVCFVPYSSPLLDDYNLMYNMHFIRNLNLIFCEKQHSYEYVTTRLGPTIRSGHQKVFETGFPKFDLNREIPGAESEAWPRSRQPGITRIIWTPRWTLDARLGASSFFDYKDEMLRWAEEDPALDLLFRPHPLALTTYVSQGYMTQEELDAYLERCRTLENTAVDRAPTYYETFWSSDILITDVSSMLLDYMLTGKPILYCPTPAGKKMSDDPSYAIRSLLDGMYVVHNMQEIRETVRRLRAGEDPKRSIREAAAARMRRNGQIGQEILRLLKENHPGK